MRRRTILATTLSAAILMLLFTSNQAQAQTQYILNSDSVYRTGTPNTGRLWGYIFGDYYYKQHSDSLSRGGANQYTGIPTKRNAFQSRRIYLGYDFNIT